MTNRYVIITFHFIEILLFFIQVVNDAIPWSIVIQITLKKSPKCPSPKTLFWSPMDFALNTKIFLQLLFNTKCFYPQRTLNMERYEQYTCVSNLQHVQHFYSTCMTSRMQYEKRRGQSFRIGILVKGWRIIALLYLSGLNIASRKSLS